MQPDERLPARAEPDPSTTVDAGRSTWRVARSELDGLPDGGLNMAHEAVDRHLSGPRADQAALRWRGRRDERRELTYADLAEQTSRVANALVALGVAPGDVVVTLLGRVPEMHVVALGALKARAVVAPLFTAFGPEPIRERIALGAGRVLVTTSLHYRRRVAPVRDQLPTVEHVLLVDGDRRPEPGTTSLPELLERASPSFAIAPTAPEDPALLHFTSGTTGTPKGALHVHEAVVHHHHSARVALDLRPGDVYWCTADPGWVTGMSYGIIAPLTCGATCVVDEGDLDADRWYSIIEEERVEVWYTAPTAIRMLKRAGPGPAAAHDLGSLRHVASVGEPLEPDSVRWGSEILGRPVHDTWWQTETGGIMIANVPGAELRPGSMGRPLPGIEAAILASDADGDLLLQEGEPQVVDEPGAEGQLALRVGWPSMFRAYLGQEERYRRCFADDWYVSGDLARRDDDGFFWFMGRSDDVIKSAGHLIGPFEVERVLVEHPSVLEAGVIGTPDPVAGSVVKAFVSLNPDQEASDALAREILGMARSRLGPAVAPREVRFVDALPHTRSGKIVRRLLRARELGLDEGDLSTLEPT